MTGGRRLRVLRHCVGALACAALLACDMDLWGPPSAGVVDVWVSAPDAHDQAIILVFDQPVEGFTAAPGFQLFQDSAIRSSTFLLVAAAPMAQGETRVGSLPVRDVRDAASMAATVLEAARSDHVLRESTAGYRVRLSW